MVDWTLVLAVAAGAALAWLAASALRHRVVGRMAGRNAMRRPRQSAMVVAGLMVGTAIVSGALVASDSLDQSIRQATFESFGEIDETVFLQGYSFFPEYVADELAADPELVRVSEGVAPQAIWDASVVNARTDLYEPVARVIGFDPERDDAFGPFLDGKQAFDGRDLGRDDVILTQTLATALDARVGDRIVMNFTRPVDPVLPRVLNISGRVTAAGSGLPIGGTPAATPYQGQFQVDSNALGVHVGIGWNPQGGDLDLSVTAPDGQTRENRGGTASEPDPPAVVSRNGTLAEPLPSGTWSFTVDAKAAVDTPFSGFVVVLYAEYDLAKIAARLDDLDRSGLPVDFEELMGGVERHSATLTVRRIADGGKATQFLDPNTFFMRLDALQVLLGRQGQVNIVRITNPGGVTEGPETAERVYPVVWSALNETKQRHPESAAVQALRAENDKVFWLHIAETTGALFTTFLGFVSSFSVIAGLLLILNIFAMLAEERKSELGISRALGLRRRDLVRLFAFEGTLYALVAALLGTFLGLGLAAILVWGFNAFFSGIGVPAVPFHVEGTSLVLAFSIGIVLTLGTIWVAARRSSRLNIVRAIRKIEEPEILRDRASGAWAVVLLAGGLAATGWGLATNSFAAQVLGPAAAAVGAALVLRRFARRKTVYPAVSLALFAYLTLTLFLISEYDDESGQFFGPVRAIIMAATLTIIILYNERATRGLAWLLQRVRRLRPVARPATSYPLHKKFRTGMTLLMFAVILLMVSLFSIFGNLFLVDPEREMGGYHVRAQSTQEIETLAGHGRDAAALDPVASYDVLPFFFKLGGDLVTVSGQTTGQFGPPRDTVWGMDDDFARRNGFNLVFRHPDYETDEAAYSAVAGDPDLVIVSYHYSTTAQGQDFGHEVGETLQLHSRGGQVEFTIVGIQQQTHLKGVFIQKDLVPRYFSNPDTMILFRLDDPSAAGDVAKALEANYRDIGLDASDYRAEIVEEQQQFRQILSMVQIFLGLGLVVGILSLGIVTARNVVERRQEIGMMRALGFFRGDIRRAFLVEMLAVVTLGVLIGAAVAILVSYAVWVALLQEFDVPFRVPWGELAAIAAIAFVTTTLATLSPIVRASRTPPADALRYIE